MKEPTAVGIDLGGTKVRIVLIDAENRVLASERFPTESGGDSDTVLSAIATHVKEMLATAGRSAGAVGIGVAGQVEKGSGVVRFAPNIGWRNVPVGVYLKDALGLPVIVNNDVRSATWGEWRMGAGKGTDDLLCLFVGTGIGGGIVSGGRLLEGCDNSAGELGHVTIVAGGRKCRCPNKGCLEAYAGGWAIAERAKEAVQRDPASGKALVGIAGSIGQISAETVTRAGEFGDVLATRLVEETVQFLAAGVVSLLNALNPCLLIVGGGVADGGMFGLPRLEAEVRMSALPSALQNFAMLPAALGSQAVAIGAAGLARKEVKG